MITNGFFFNVLRFKTFYFKHNNKNTIMTDNNDINVRNNNRTPPLIQNDNFLPIEHSNSLDSIIFPNYPSDDENSIGLDDNHPLRSFGFSSDELPVIRFDTLSPSFQSISPIDNLSTHNTFSGTDSNSSKKSSNSDDNEYHDNDSDANSSKNTTPTGYIPLEFVNSQIAPLQPEENTKKRVNSNLETIFEGQLLQTPPTLQPPKKRVCRKEPFLLDFNDNSNSSDDPVTVPAVQNDDTQMNNAKFMMDYDDKDGNREELVLVNKIEKLDISMEICNTK